MSSLSDAANILLSDDHETVLEKIRPYAYSGSRSRIEAHREHTGDREVDIPYQFLYYFLEESDERVEQLACGYRDGTLLGGELKRSLRRR